MLHSEGTHKIIRRSLIGFLITIVVLVPALLIFSAYFTPTPDGDDRRAICARALENLGKAVQARGGRVPEDLTDLAPGRPQDLTCPADPSPGPASYSFLPVQSRPPSACIIAFENGTFHGLGINVLLAGGSVEYLMESAFLDRLRELLQPPHRQYYTEAAIKIMEAKTGPQ